MPDSVFGTVHTEKFNGMLGTQVTGGKQSATLDAKFHQYALEWNAEKIDFFIDGKRFQTFQNRHEGIEAWPFDRDFHVLLNLASRSAAIGAEKWGWILPSGRAIFSGFRARLPVMWNAEFKK